MSETRETCETCRFFLEPEEQSIHGHCNRYPPQHVGWVPISEGTISFSQARWPEVWHSDWCGEWAALRKARGE